MVHMRSGSALVGAVALALVVASGGCTGGAGTGGDGGGGDGGARPGPTPEDASRICALLVSCGAETESALTSPLTVSYCAFVVSLIGAAGDPGLLDPVLREPEFARLSRCVVEAATCDGLQSCLRSGVPASACASSTDSGTACVDGKLVYCDSPGNNLFGDAVPLVGDCAASGNECVSVRGRSACARAATCAAGAARCEGDRLVFCDADVGREVAVDCAAMGPGAACDAASSTCRVPTNACTSELPTCDGNVAVGCYRRTSETRGLFSSREVPTSGGEYVEARIDCTALGTTCASGLCQPGRALCSAMDPGACAGDSVELCLFDRRRSVSCPSIGYRTCEVRAYEGGARAICVR